MSDALLLERFCPICGLSLLPSGECTTKGCLYFLDDPNTIDISFKSKGIAKALSNLCSYNFTFDGVPCASMESFIQSLRVPQVQLQMDICSKTGPFCYSIRTMLNDWRKDKTVYWKGQAINRFSKDYSALIRSAYFSLCDSSPIFAYALHQSKGCTLKHSIGCSDKGETLLTPDEFISNLEHLRGN